MLLGMVLCLFAYIAYCFLFGLHGRLESVLFQSPDSPGYRAVADWIYHGGSMPGSAAKRPYLYPLMLGLPLMVSPGAVWFMNICCWLGSIFLVSRAAWKLSGSRIVILIVWLAFSVNLSLMDLSLRALSELPLLFILSLWVFKLVHVDFENPRVVDIVSIVLLMVAATLVKPLFQLHVLLLLVVLPLIPSVRRLFRRRPLHLLVGVLLALMPLVPQLLIVHSITGKFALSTAGSEELKRYIIPEFVLRLESPLSWGDRRQMIEETREKISDWTGGDCIRLVAQHPLVFTKLLVENILRDNLMEGSMTSGDQPLVFVLSKLHNTLVTLLHIYMMPLILLIVLAQGIKTPELILLILAVSAAVIFVTSGIVFWAGDRIIVIAEPLWLTAYLGALSIVTRHPAFQSVFCRGED